MRKNDLMRFSSNDMPTQSKSQLVMVKTQQTKEEQRDPRLNAHPTSSLLGNSS